MARQRITIPLYGPRGLRYSQSQSALRLILDQLGVDVAEPAELIPTRPERPLRPTTEKEIQEEPPWTVPPPPQVKPPPHPWETGEVWDEFANVLYFRGVDLQRLKPTVLERVRFSPIKHQGLIYVIESASFLPREAIDIVQGEAEKRGITVLPIYVRGIT